MLNFPVASVDGYGDRDDIALAHDISQGIARDNAAKEFNQILPAHEWGDCTQKNIVDLVSEMIKSDKSQMLGNKADLFWGDIETISEAVNEACIRLGLDEDQFSPYLHIDGHEYEITLYA